MADTYKAVARVVKAHGNKGKVVVAARDGLPFVLREGMRVACVPPEAKRDRFHVVESVEQGASGALVGLSGSRGRDDAEHLAGKVVLVRAADLPAGFELHDAPSLVGREVADASLGFSATRAEVMQGPANDVWVLDCDGREVLVPVIDEVVSEVPEKGPIPIRLPDGII